MKHGPGRGEVLFRLVFSLAGLVFLGGAIAFRGIAGIASAEMVLIALAFFGGTTIWAAYRLWRGR